ncbi:MAG: leucyl aminopeptidase family protein [Bacteroidetes bacterium]|nr:leucyl aminopeptidase family protein [Bacteroidota bacterium]
MRSPVSNHIILVSTAEQLREANLPDAVRACFAAKWNADVWSYTYTAAEGNWYLEKAGKLEGNEEKERLRKSGSSLCKLLQADKAGSVFLSNLTGKPEAGLSLAEGLWLSNYAFHRYLKEDKKPHILSTLNYEGAGAREWPALQLVCEAVFRTRDLVNEPVNQLNATGLADAFVNMGAEAGFTVEVWNEAKIESNKMGGLLAVNKGSQEPPTFSIMEYKPANAVNEKPIVLVGKGVVFDTGGLSLKPTPQSMDHMKCDMAGSAVVAGTFWAAARLKLPVWLIGLVPATDNRPGENAICPGDIITTYDGTTVEILNTDAEGRLILCDALAFARKYDPEVVFDFATLTGAAARALGAYGSAMMGTAGTEIKEAVKLAGDTVYERLAEFPLWEEYFEDTKGDISDLKNLGKGEGGAQSAAMFLRHFTQYPWLHFDIAGTAFNMAADHYRPKGGTGVGVRLMMEFLQKRVNGK